MFRHTRATLRAYQERGMVKGGLAIRKPEDILVVFRTDTERELYNQIDDLCSHFYRLADLPAEERSGVGFLMVVFRKRLASCFAAFQRSLERRRDLIAAIQQRLSDFDARPDLKGKCLSEEEDEDFDTEITTPSTGSANGSCVCIIIRGGEMSWKPNGPWRRREWGGNQGQRRGSSLDLG